MNKKGLNSPLQILVVSNDTETIKFHKMLFNDLGHQLSCAVNAYDAIDIFTRYYENGRPFDLVFTDYLVPGMNGISMAKRLRKIYKDVIQVLLPTPFFTEGTIQKAYNDFGGFIQEPDTSFKSYQLVLKKVNDFKKNNNLTKAKEDSLLSEVLI